MAKKTINVQQVMDYSVSGMKPSEIAAKLSTADFKVTHQMVTSIIKENTPKVQSGSEDDEPHVADAVTINPTETMDTHADLVQDPIEDYPDDVQECTLMDAAEYEEYSKKRGRTAFGGVVGKKLNPKVEELRALINSHWTPSRVMEKWQLSELDLKWLVRELSEAELRPKDIVCNFKQDFFR